MEQSDSFGNDSPQPLQWRVVTSRWTHWTQ